MPNFRLNFILSFPIAFLFLVLFSTSVYADRSITSVTLDGAASVTVAPSASITAAVNVTTIAGGAGGAVWQGTSWTVNGVTTCVDTPNNNSVGSYSESFTITAPASDGMYDASFIAYSNNACTQNPSATHTISGGITVSSATPTPGPTATPGPGATATPAPGSTSAPSTSTGTTITPTVSLSSYPSGNTPELTPFFSGTASVDGGTVTLVEYTIDGGANWTAVNPTDGKFDSGSESFSFNSRSLTPGAYTVSIRAKSLAGVYSSNTTTTFTVVPSPPSITLTPILPNPSKDTTPVIAGSVSSRFLTITKVEVSLDGGGSWTPVSFGQGRFSFTPQPLEDGNYDIVARAFDNQENIGTSETQTLIIDLLPPVIGGATFSLGPQVLTPPAGKSLNVIAGADITLAVSMKGGVTLATASIGGVNYDLKRHAGTHVWVGTVGFKDQGVQDLLINAVDGAGNTAEKSLGQVLVLPPGIIKDSANGSPLEGAGVSVHVYNESTKSWVVWDAGTYGQASPQNTKADGSYSFMVPAGKYYLEVDAPGFFTTQSQILNIDSLSAINSDFNMRPKPKIILNLPILGEILITIPDIFPPDTNQITINQGLSTGIEESENLVGKITPDLTLPNIEEENVAVSGLRGQKLVLTFISLWSPQSVEQAGILSELTKDSLPENSSILVVALQETESEAQAFMNSGNYSFTLLTDKNGITAEDYKVTLLPQSLFIDSTGIVREIHIGLLGKTEILNKLANMQ